MVPWLPDIVSPETAFEKPLASRVQKKEKGNVLNKM